MNSSPTRALPIRSPHGTRLDLRAVAAAMALALGVWCCATADAHEAGDGSIPDTPGLRIDAAAAIAAYHAQAPIPTQRLGGVLGLGDTPSDQRGTHLEHATLGLGARLLPQVGVYVAAGWHGSEPGHIEAAWLQARPSQDSAFALGAGRNRVPIGALLNNAGHLDRYGQMPLAKRATFNGDWIEDGVNAAWRPHLDGPLAWLEALDVGLWKAQRFPGSLDGGWAPVVHLRGAWDTWAIDAFYSRLRPQGRGTYVQSSTSGHVHTAPACDTSLRGIACFDGSVDLLGGSATWVTPLPGVQLSGAALWRRERGALYSQNGDARYAGKTLGGWLEALWQPSARWDFGVRQEWLRGTHDVSGPGAYAVATDANLLPNTPARRLSAMAGWRPAPGWLVALEAGRERLTDRHNTSVGLRLVWTPSEALWKRNW